MSDMYNLLEQLCHEKGVNITQMSRETKIPRSVFSELKAGRTKCLSNKYLPLLAEYFGVSVDYLLGNEKEPATDSDGFRLEDDIDLTDVDIAFLGGFKELTEENQATIRDMVRIMRERQKE